MDLLPHRCRCLCPILALWLSQLLTPAACGGESPAGLRPFLEQHCYECHDADSKKGGLDLVTLAWREGDRQAFEHWVKVFDKVDKQDMPPPKEKDRPDAATREAFLKMLRTDLHAASLARQQSEGRLPINIPCDFPAAHPTSPRESL